MGLQGRHRGIEIMHKLYRCVQTHMSYFVSNDDKTAEWCQAESVVLFLRVSSPSNNWGVVLTSKGVREIFMRYIEPI